MQRTVKGNVAPRLGKSSSVRRTCHRYGVEIGEVAVKFEMNGQVLGRAAVSFHKVAHEVKHKHIVHRKRVARLAEGARHNKAAVAVYQTQVAVTE